MATIKSKIKGAQATPFMADFVPMNTLWEGSNAPYPSKYSAQWAVRKLRDDLAAARAVALHCGALMVHPQRFAEVAEKAAIDQFANRVTKCDLA
jgi:hypothetical protein